MKTLPATFVMLVVALTATAQDSQSQAQDFFVSVSDTFTTVNGTRPAGIVVLVSERGSGKAIISRATGNVTMNGNIDTARRIALGITSQFSGAGQPIASGAFIIVKDELSKDGHEYTAAVHRFRPEEIHPNRGVKRHASVMRNTISRLFPS
jgi:hypothetical protein